MRAGSRLSVRFSNLFHNSRSPESSFPDLVRAVTADFPSFTAGLSFRRVNHEKLKLHPTAISARRCPRFAPPSATLSDRTGRLLFVDHWAAAEAAAEEPNISVRHPLHLIVFSRSLKSRQNFAVTPISEPVERTFLPKGAHAVTALCDQWRW